MPGQNGELLPGCHLIVPFAGKVATSPVPSLGPPKLSVGTKTQIGTSSLPSGAPMGARVIQPLYAL